ncbi:MAG: DNA mismatch repair endonuclease MutL [Chloroflexi bacterium]|nr:DNA mismatch repair endonuclease MutL [Chloroflexota bacterium]
MPIRVLPPQLAARIAAGEVIERPASVVKELVENALDGGATRINVEVVDGGRSLIRVVDNGHGIPAGEIATAFERFATSKIDEASDLMGIETLGFRGEALPSIASVARVSLTTLADGAGRGARAEVEFGGAVRVEPAGVPAGTSIVVKDLFRRTPARLKFLGSPATELARSHHVVATYALTRPDVAFTLQADGQTRFSTPGRGALLDAAAGVYGWNLARNLLTVGPPAVRAGTSAFSAEGLTGAPTLTRGNRNYITLSVNGRWIESRRLAFAVEQAYQGFLEDRRFPVAILQVTVPPGDLDVNVLPAKTEVRFLREQVVFAEVGRAVRAALVGGAPVPQVRAPSAQDSGSAAGRVIAWPDYALWPSPADRMGSPAKDAEGPAGQPAVLVPERGPDAVVQGAAEAHPMAETRKESAPPTPQRSLPVLRVLGQSHDTYLIAEGPEGIYLIDQHAAHERVVFEEIRSRLGKPVEGGQQLLSPDVVQLLPQHEQLMREHAGLLREVGFEVEPFGPRSAIVRAVPRVLPGGTGAEALVRLLESLADGGGTAVWRERVLATLACHAAVRAGRRMTVDESTELVRKLERVEQPHTCPHGRPTMVYLSIAALERDFRRR